MANGKPQQGAFRAKNGVWCVKKKCERCGREFNAGYFLDGVKYLRAAEQDVSAPSLFDLCDVEHTRGAA